MKRRLGTVLLTLLVLAGCGGESDTDTEIPTVPPPAGDGTGSGGNSPEAPPPEPGDGGGDTSKPAAQLFRGKVLFGIYQSSSRRYDDLRVLEQNIGQMPLVKRYHDFSGDLNSPATEQYPEKSGLFPDLSETRWLGEGRTLHLAWETCIYNGKAPAGMPLPAAKTADGSAYVSYTYAQIASGQLDAYLDVVAARLRTLDRPIMVTFNHEWDDASDLGGSNDCRKAAGTPEQFGAAFRYIVKHMRDAGVTQVAWVWTVSGWQGSDGLYLRGWPGSQWVDVIGWDPYNHNVVAWTGPQALFKRFYDRIDAGTMFGDDATAAKALPRVLSEYGSVKDPANGARQAEWIRELPEALAALPRLRSLEWYNAWPGGGWDTRLDAAAAQQAFGEVRAKLGR